MRKIIFITLVSIMFFWANNIVYSESVPGHIQKLVFESSDFAEPITLRLPGDDRDSKEMVFKWARDGGLPPAVLWAWAGYDSDKGVLNFLIRSGFAIVERFEYRLKITPDFQQAYNFLFYTDKIKPFIKNGTIEEGFSIILARRKLQSIADIDHHWEKDSYGFKREIFSFSFLYTLEEEFPNLPNIKRLYRGTAALYLDTAVTTEWKFRSFNLEDAGASEYISLLNKQFGTEEIHVQPLTREATQRKEILDYTKETEVENGLHLVLKVDCSRLPSGVHRDVVQRIAKIIVNRLSLFCSDKKIPFGVYMLGVDEIIVQFPSVLERERALSLIGRTGYIEFKPVSDDTEKLRQALEDNIPQGYELRYLNEQPLLLEKKASLTDVSFKNVFVHEGQFNQPTVVLEFNSKGAQEFAKILRDNVGRRLAIVLDGKIQSILLIFEHYVLYVGEIKGNELKHVYIYQFEPDKPTRTIFAQSAELSPSGDKLKLCNGIADEPDPRNPNSFYKLKFNTYILNVSRSDQIEKNPNRAVITGQFSDDEANDLAIALKTGALPAPVMIEEERTISGVIGFDFQDTQGIIVEAVFPTPITAENLKNKLDSMGISGYIQMLGREEKKYLIWLKTSPAQAEKAIKELVKNNSGDLLRIEAVSERIKPDLERESISKSESFQEELKSKEKQPPYFVVIEGKQYKVGGDIFTGKKEGRVFKDEKGTIVRDLVLAKKIAQAAWVYENIVRPSGPPRSQQVSAILDTYKALQRYEVAQDILARASVQILAATISGGTTFTYTVPAGLTWRVVHDQFVNLKGLLSLTGRQGLEEALSEYKQMESLIAKLKPNYIDEAAATEIKRLYDSAYVLDLPYSALLASLMPKRGSQLVDNALKSIGDELVRTLPLSDKAISDAVLTNRELFDLQGKMDDALKTDPAFKEYYEKLNLAKRLTEANGQTITAWAEAAVQYKE